MMILLEIVNLLKFGIFRPYEYDLIIWDTAPTVHTLRLLELPGKVLKWIEVFETSFLRYNRVAVGAATIGFKIPGRTPPKGNVRTFLDTFSKDLEKVRAILKDEERCEFNPVTIAEELSIAETQRLLATLRGEGIPVRNIIVNRIQEEKKCAFCSARGEGQEGYLREIDEKFSSYNLVKVFLFSNEVRGKDGLLRFGDFLSGNDRQYSPPQSTLELEPLKDEDKFTPLEQNSLTGFMPGMLSEVLNKDLQFIIFGGKGGVGKTTVSAATALSIARYNPDKKILVFSTDPAHSLVDSFATSIGDTVTAIKAESLQDTSLSNLYALEIDATRLYEDFRKEYKVNIEDAFKKWQNSYLAGGRKWKMDFDEKVMVEFVDTYPPGLEEVLALEKIMGFIKTGDFDIYIFDTAPTGHLIELLKIPELVREWLRVTYRAILRYHREVPVDNIEVLAKKILASQETVQKMHAFLTDPQKSEFIAVTIPEAMGMLETEDLLLSIRDLGIPCSHIVVNMIIPPTDCDFCRSKRNEQIDYIRQIDEKTEYKGYEIVKVPLYPHEIRGIDNLMELAKFMYGTQMNVDISENQRIKCVLIDPPDEIPDSCQRQDAHQTTEMHEVYPPLGLLYIAAELKQNGVDVRLIEARSMRLSHGEVIEEVRKENPDFVGITAITARINSALYLSAKVKEINPDIKVILGGPHVNFEHRTVIGDPSVDICVRGEGEITTLELIKTLQEGGNLENVRGITFKDKNNEVVVTPDRSNVAALDTLHFPARGLLQSPVYRGLWTEGETFSPVLATRGCPFRCQFCDAPAIWGRMQRRRTVANVLDELEQIYKEFGVRYVRFVDDLVVVNKKWAIELCRGMRERGLNDLSWACDGRVGLMSEELLEELKMANCKVIFYGVEFGNQRILDLCKKGFKIKQVKETIEMTSKVGISSYGYFMMGYPTETIETVEDTIKLAVELALDYGMDSAGFSIVTPFPGTGLYEYCKRNNMLKSTDWSQYSYQLGKGVIKLEHITDEELAGLYEKALYEFQFREKLRQFV
ncbi:MAG: TRC40/GET3/ArsA family transport-energizing ATPase [Thermodesulfovibrionales bacterium]|nr:TRC40/GET3/ArsA family transport-energizing ATPase [Thermodesulfovibrionales bacterium]